MKWLFELKEDYKCMLAEFINDDELQELKSELREDKDFFAPRGSSKPRLRITKEGEIIVFQGYAWDGNSPKINFLDLFWIGTPDGIQTHNRPITYYASLIHDVLGQFKREPEMLSRFKSTESPELWFSKGRRGRDGLYLSMLKNENFMFRHLYYLAVSLAGPLYDAYLAWFKKVDFTDHGNRRA
ncbi:MAG: hypothetical protein KME05_18170 [Gloeocapsa sp. UFS-A4-WI-NPMV-4B04]|jgi:hypothetical protein|nr:hypothetical protein [Gloeocapsa sp. UFS-A4-WI-NPMV-4B04]